MEEIETSKIITADSPEGQIAVKTFCEEYNRAKISEERAGYLNRMNHRLFAFSIGLCIRNSSHYIPNYEEAREILGNDFISPEELKIKKSQRWFDYSQKQLSFFRGSIPSKSVLEFGRKYDYILFPGPGWDMDTARILFVNSAGKKDSFGYVNNWVEIRDFTVGPRWYMMRKYPVPGSDSVKYYSSMENLISKHEFIPNLAMVMWGITTYAIARNINLFNDFEIVTHMQPFCIPYITLINGNKGLYIGENYSEAINRYPASWNKKTVLTSFVRL